MRNKCTIFMFFHSDVACSFLNLQSHALSAMFVCLKQETYLETSRSWIIGARGLARFGTDRRHLSSAKSRRGTYGHSYESGDERTRSLRSYVSN